MRFVPILVLVTCSTTTALALAGPREEVLRRAAQCASLPDDAAWLACYRAAAAPMEASIATAVAPATSAPAAAPAPPPKAPSSPARVQPAVSAAAAPPPATDLSGFGVSGNPKANELTAPSGKIHPAPETAATDHITARVLKASFSSQRYFTLVLDNGQTWQQINGDNDFAVLTRPAAGYEVTIKHGFFGSYNLTFAGVAGLFRVRRIA